MRIVAQIKHPVLKITVFQHNGVYSFQIEDGQTKQSYSLREDVSLNSSESVVAFIKTQIPVIEEIGIKMQSVISGIAKSIQTDDELPKII